MKTATRFLCVCGLIFCSFIARGEPAPEPAKALVRAAAAALTNGLAGLPPEERDHLLASLQDTLAYYQQVLTTTNWNEFITSTSHWSAPIHVLFQFYFGVRTNFDDLDPWHRLSLLAATLPIGEDGLEPHDLSKLAEKDKQRKIIWLNTFLELGPEQVLKRSFAPPSTMLSLAQQTVAELFKQPYLLEKLSIQDLKTVMRFVEARRKMHEADAAHLQKIALDRAAITGTEPDTMWIRKIKRKYHVIPLIAYRVLSPTGQNRLFNTNLVSACLEPIGLWLEDQCCKLEQLWIGLTNAYFRGLYYIPNSGSDRRPMFWFRDGLNELVPVMSRVSKMVTPGFVPRQPPPLQPDDKQMLMLVQAYRPFDPESPDLNRALEAVKRGDLDLCGDTLVIEFAIRNLFHPLDLLAQWSGRLPENQRIAESLKNIVTRLNRFSEGLALLRINVRHPPLYIEAGSVPEN